MEEEEEGREEKKTVSGHSKGWRWQMRSSRAKHLEGTHLETAATFIFESDGAGRASREEEENMMAASRLL